MQKQKQNQAVTYAKATAIMLMVLCHSAIGNEHIVDFVYMFHMPLFFFLSGYCLKTEYFLQPRVFAWKRMKGIYWPYLKWSLVFLLLHNVFFALNIYNGQYGYNGVGSEQYSQGEMMQRLTNIVFLMDKHEGLLGGYWFMRALFRGSLIAFGLLWILNVISKKQKIRYAYNLLIEVLFLLTLCLALSHLHRTLTVFCFSSQDFLAAIFFLIGHAFRHYSVRKLRTWEWIVTIAFVIVGSFYWKLTTGVTVYENARMLPYIVTAVLGTWEVYSLPWHRMTGRAASLVQFVGNNTLTVLTWHFLAFKLVSLLIIYMYGLPMARLAEFPVITDYAVRGWWLAYFLLAMSATCAIAYCNRWIRSPWLKL